MGTCGSPSGSVDRYVKRPAPPRPLTPPVPPRYARHEVVRALFVPQRQAVNHGTAIDADVIVVTTGELIGPRS